MSYHYKAHGCAPLSLCRGMERERVFSPYSTYLALEADPAGAMENLRRWAKTPMGCAYGFYEALDCTPDRCRGEGVPVYSVMAHHVGMSLVAVTNALRDGLWQRRFMKDPAMGAFRLLLEEQIPLGSPLLRRRTAPLASQTDGKPVFSPERRESVSPDSREGVVLSNGVYSLLLTESGRARATFGRLAVYRPAEHPWGNAHGVELRLYTEGSWKSLLPETEDGGEYSAEWEPGRFVLRGQREELRWSMEVLVSPEYNGEVRRVTLSHPKGTGGHVALLLEPWLLPPGDGLAHPSFARLGLHTVREGDVLLCHRLPRGQQRDVYLALSTDREAVFSSDGRRFPGRGDGILCPEENTGWQCESRLALWVALDPEKEKETIAFSLAAAPERELAMEGARAILRERQGFSMESAAAVTLGFTDEDRRLAEGLLPRLAFPALSEEAGALPAPEDRSGLWRHGISGDVPILLFEGDAEEAAQALRCHGYLSFCGIACDLVIPMPPDEYRQAFGRRVREMLEKMGRSAVSGARGGVHLVPAADSEGIRSVCAAVWGQPSASLSPARQFSLPKPPLCNCAVPLWSRQGLIVSFTMYESLPPRCWGNMLTNGQLGYFATETGTGSMWLCNAREQTVTPWAGDPLLTGGPELLWAEVNGRAVSFFADGQGITRVRYAPGRAVWDRKVDGITLRLTAFIPPDRNTRVFLLRCSAPCLVFWCAPLVPGGDRNEKNVSVHRVGGALRAESPQMTLFARCTGGFTEVCSDEESFHRGHLRFPRRCALPCVGGCFTPEGECVLLLGSEDAPELVSPLRARDSLSRAGLWWAERLQTPFPACEDPLLRDFAQGWLYYQTLAGRLWGRSSPYQSGGAIGFRDQLQDYVNLLPMEKSGCREHILQCCAHQFTEGDVQHWWHPAEGSVHRGIRTRCSDDLLWLPWAVESYIRETGDIALLDASAPWLTSPVPAPGESSRYELPALAGECSSVREHCKRAMELVWSRGTGQHGLLLMGSGDWNDSFDGMGEGSESVWLTFFASIVLHRWASLTGESLWEERAAILGHAADSAWDGDHYLRGYYGDGTPLGNAGAEHCAIDSVSQSFAAFCPYADRQRVDTALTAAVGQLWDRERHLVCLFIPPFDGTGRSPGYTGSYGPGFRENGGQYTHGGIWLAMALLRTGRASVGQELLRDMVRSLQMPEYGGEPYVLPADIATAHGMEGRAGWTWYTGSAGWMLRAVFRELPEAKKRADDGKNS